MMEFCTQVVRELGYTGLVGQFDVPVWFGDNAVRSRYSQFALGHSYWSHAIGINLYQQRDAFRGSRAATMQSSIESSILYWRNLAAAKFADRPYFVTETNHCIPNPYSYEFGLVMGAYSAFQGFRALLPHSYPVFLEPKRLEPFAIGSNPVARASNILLYSLFMRGDVTPSRHNVSLEVAPELLRYFQPVSPEQTKLALMTGFSLSFPGTERPEGVRRDVPVTLALPATRTDGLYKPELDDAIGAGSGRDRKFSAAGIHPTLRKKGVLPRETSPIRNAASTRAIPGNSRSTHRRRSWRSAPRAPRSLPHRGRFGETRRLHHRIDQHRWLHCADFAGRESALLESENAARILHLSGQSQREDLLHRRLLARLAERRPRPHAAQREVPRHAETPAG
ncbi:MAG: hypothetical protein L6W00_24620 [Lentisphaeria bacterium]|nr:MAG: hypothetical protein L6W00_24620 [Lentisphaeria bacterium]